MIVLLSYGLIGYLVDSGQAAFASEPSYFGFLVAVFLIVCLFAGSVWNHLWKWWQLKKTFEKADDKKSAHFTGFTWRKSDSSEDKEI